MTNAITLPPTTEIRARLRELRNETVVVRRLLEAARERDRANRERKRREAAHAS